MDGTNTLRYGSFAPITTQSYCHTGNLCHHPVKNPPSITNPKKPPLSHLYNPLENAVLRAEIPTLQKSRNPVTHDHDRQLTNVQTSDDCRRDNRRLATSAVSVALAWSTNERERDADRGVETIAKFLSKIRVGFKVQFFRPQPPSTGIM
jgi:hypothetical protein